MQPFGPGNKGFNNEGPLSPCRNWPAWSRDVEERECVRGVAHTNEKTTPLENDAVQKEPSTLPPVGVGCASHTKLACKCVSEYSVSVSSMTLVV